MWWYKINSKTLLRNEKQNKRSLNLFAGILVDINLQWNGQIDFDHAEEIIQKQTTEDLCDYLLFFGDIYYEYDHEGNLNDDCDSNCKKMLGDLNNNEYCHTLQSHVWRDFTPTHHNAHWYGNLIYPLQDELNKRFSE